MPKIYRMWDAYKLYADKTGADEREMRHHSRILREAGVMSPMTGRAEAADMAALILGMLAGAKHVDAPKAAIRMFHAVMADLTTGREAVLKDIGPIDLITALAILIRKIRETGKDLIASIDAAVDGSIVTITTMTGHAMHFVPHPDPEDDPPPPDGVYPVAVTRVLDGRVVTALAALVGDEPRLSPQEIAAARERLKELFDQTYGDVPT